MSKFAPEIIHTREGLLSSLSLKRMAVKSQCFGVVSYWDSGLLEKHERNGSSDAYMEILI